MIEKNGKFYWYAAVSHAGIHGKAIGIAVSDSPTGPFTGASGSALITNDMTKDAKILWDDIDPTVILDDDGQAYSFWGNTFCYYAKWKPNMIELDGILKRWRVYQNILRLHKRKGLYYLSYAIGFPEKITYSMSENINGTWIYKGVVNEIPANSTTNHQAIIDFKVQEREIWPVLPAVIIDNSISLIELYKKEQSLKETAL